MGPTLGENEVFRRFEFFATVAVTIVIRWHIKRFGQYCLHPLVCLLSLLGQTNLSENTVEVLVIRRARPYRISQRYLYRLVDVLADGRVFWWKGSNAIDALLVWPGHDAGLLNCFRHVFGRISRWGTTSPSKRKGVLHCPLICKRCRKPLFIRTSTPCRSLHVPCPPETRGSGNDSRGSIP